jgi:hypothetical protein
MTKSSYIIEGTNLLGGLNQDADHASQEECEDCLNVWAVNGRVETRPGYVGLWNCFLDYEGFDSALRSVSEINGVFTSDAGGGVLDLSNLVENRDRWYLGYTEKFAAIRHTVPGLNSNATTMRAEYWNGTAWKHLEAVNLDGTTEAAQGNAYLSTSTQWITFVPPQDWVSSTVNSLTKYWVRFNILCNDLDAAVSVDILSVSVRIRLASALERVAGLFSVQYPSTKFVALDNRAQGTLSTASRQVVTLQDIGHRSGTPQIQSFLTGAAGNNTDAPSTLAIVPQFEESFLAYNHRVTRFGLPTETPADALVEGSDFAVGPGAAFDKTLVAQLQEWPRAKYTVFFGGRLWAAGLEDQPYTIRWSAAQPFHKVWPNLSNEVLMEDDNSPITAIAGLGEQLVVFKSDSIWLMIAVGENAATGVESFIPKRIVAGVGCVASNSIQQVQGGLVFLAESGVYFFDGSKATNLSEREDADRLKDIIASISPTRRQYAASAHWRKNKVYLLSFSTKSSNLTHDVTLCWEYEGGTGSGRWWKWSGIDAQVWCRSEGSSDEERLFFGDSKGGICEFGKGQTDHGGTITSSITTHRFGYRTDAERQLRSVRCISDNLTRSLLVQSSANDRPLRGQTKDLTDYNEEDWSTLSWGSGGTDQWTPERRRAVRQLTQNEGSWHQVKVTHSTKNERMALSRVEVGYEIVGRR